MKKALSLITICLFTMNIALAQDNNAGGASENSSLVEDTKRDLYIITGAGLGGAILGLSTLSFVEEPDDHWKNVIVGGAIGIIGGVLVVASMQADRTGSYIDPEYVSLDPKDFATQLRKSWHVASFKENNKTSVGMPTVAWNFQF